MLSYALSYFPWLAVYGVWIPVLVGAALVAWFVPLLRTPALATIAAIVAGLYCFQYGDEIGAKRIQDQWNLALQQEAEDGAEIAVEAERHVRSLLPDSVRGHPWNRDGRK